MSMIIYDWEIKLNSGASERIAGFEPTESESEITFELEDGGTKAYRKADVKSFKPTGFRPFFVE